MIVVNFTKLHVKYIRIFLVITVIKRFQLAAVKGISQVVISRIVMCAPGMRMYRITDQTF